nr:hypothetical protein [uncultured Neisseria sp.]
MANIILNSQLHTLACHLVKVDNRVDIKKEIRYLNDRYKLVPEEQFPAFEQDLQDMYEFEKKRQVKKIDIAGYTRFKLDQVTKNAALEYDDAYLDEQLGCYSQV